MECEGDNEATSNRSTIMIAINNIIKNRSEVIPFNLKYNLDLFIDFKKTNPSMIKLDKNKVKAMLSSNGYIIDNDDNIYLLCIRYVNYSHVRGTEYKNTCYDRIITVNVLYIIDGRGNHVSASRSGKKTSLFSFLKKRTVYNCPVIGMEDCRLSPIDPSSPNNILLTCNMRENSMFNPCVHISYINVEELITAMLTNNEYYLDKLIPISNSRKCEKNWLIDNKNGNINVVYSPIPLVAINISTEVLHSNSNTVNAVLFNDY